MLDRLGHFGNSRAENLHGAGQILPEASAGLVNFR